MEPTKAIKQWMVHNDGKLWQPFDHLLEPTLAPGVYDISVGMGGPCLCKISPLSDKPIMVDDGHCQRIFAGILKFWDSRVLYTEFGLLHKRGILMEGPPGSGKTMVAQMLATKLTSAGGYTIIAPFNSHAIHMMEWALRTIREYHPEAPILNVIEDLDSRISEGDLDVEELLSILDGENQIANVVHLATTNYVSNLDARFTNRPSRFDEVIRVAEPSEQARASYMRQLIPPSHFTESLLSQLVAVSNGLMLAHLRELVVSTLVLNQPLDSVATRLRTMNTTAVEAEDDSVELKATMTRRRPSRKPATKALSSKGLPIGKKVN